MHIPRDAQITAVIFGTHLCNFNSYQGAEHDYHPQKTPSWPLPSYSSSYPLDTSSVLIFFLLQIRLPVIKLSKHGSCLDSKHESWGFSGGSVVKNLPANAGDAGLIPRSGITPEEGNGNPIQYSCLENSMDGGAWQVTVYGGTKSQIWQQLNSNNKHRIIQEVICYVWHLSLSTMHLRIVYAFTSTSCLFLSTAE